MRRSSQSSVLCAPYSDAWTLTCNSRLGISRVFAATGANKAWVAAADGLLADTRWSGWHTGASPEALLGSRVPRAAQEVVLTLPLAERLDAMDRVTDNKDRGSAVFFICNGRVCENESAAALDHLNQVVATDPALAGTLHVLPSFEVVSA